MISIPETAPDPLPPAAELRRKFLEAACLFAICYPRQEAEADKVLAFELKHQRLRIGLQKLYRGEIEVKFLPTKKRTY